MDTDSSRNGETFARKVQSEPIAGIDGNGPSSPRQDLKRKHDLPVEEENGHLVGSDKSCKQITVSDVLCAECKQLLFHPVALNCGHDTSVRIVSRRLALISVEIATIPIANSPAGFNQQHRPEHKFRLKKPRTWRNYMLRLVTGRLLDDGSAALVLSNDGSEDEATLTTPASPSDVWEDAENSLAISFVIEDGGAGSEHQNNSQSNSN
ncbi:hypothetical protein NL676_002362 [Syzygium grande]|nr:hypothetical protein NL676_002362 [Syzygium grande]